MKLTVLDGYCLNPGDLSWDALRQFGEVQVFDRTRPDEVAERAAGAAIVLTNKTPLSAEVLRQLPELRYIGVLATGYNVVDVAAATAQGVVVANIPTYGTASVAQFVFALLLELCHNVRLHADAVRAGEWTNNPDWSFWKSPLMELSGKTMGIVGFGRIGRQVGRIADAMGMHVIANDTFHGEEPAWEGFRWASVEELLRESDVVSLHSPLFPETKGMINARSLTLMKHGAFLINTSRGPLVVDQDLADALNAGRSSGGRALRGTARRGQSATLGAKLFGDSAHRLGDQGGPLPSDGSGCSECHCISGGRASKCGTLNENSVNVFG
jgi:glycerate dehydrogenase